MPTGNIQCTHKFINQRCLLFHLSWKSWRRKFHQTWIRTWLTRRTLRNICPRFEFQLSHYVERCAKNKEVVHKHSCRKERKKANILHSVFSLSFEQRLTYKCWREDFCLRRMLNDFCHNCPHFPSHLLSLPPYPPLAFFLLFRHTNTHTNKAAEAARRELIQADRTQWHPWHFGGKACRF